MDETQPAFEAVLYPNQPMPTTAHRIVIGVTGGFAFLMACAFLVLGAWPVSGFMGLEFALLVVAMRCCRRRAREREHVRLDAQGLHVRRIDWRGRQRYWRLEPYWVRVIPDTIERAVKLSTQGCSISIGRFLTPEERVSFAAALRAALQGR